MRSRWPGSSVPVLLAGERTPVEQVAPARARPAAVGSARRAAAALGDQREGHLGERFELAHDAVAAAVRPAPPEPRRSAYSTTRSGNSRSSASIGVFSVLLIATCTPLGPSASAHAPWPPPSVS